MGEFELIKVEIQDKDNERRYTMIYIEDGIKNKIDEITIVNHIRLEEFMQNCMKKLFDEMLKKL